ncbi:ATP-dependent helicase [Paenibacillaceae sp. P-4]|uniref:UvrD-helicase domain-containing protein n=1 Tax=Paenibacillaceae bacterium P-4 TaxID=3160969 RepID=UPI0032E83127
MDSQLITADDKIPIENHFKVVAGPGAGKTTFLVNHVKNVMHNSTRLGRNRKVACITYTNVGVETLLDRLKEGNDHVEVCTIHSFLFEHVLKPYFSLINGVHNIDVTKITVPFDHVVSGYFKKTNLESKYKLSNKDLIKNIFWFIEDDICKLHIRGRKKDMHSDLYNYKKMFWEKGIIHHDDVLALSWEILHNHPGALRVIRSKFPYVFIDEFQDTSPIQAEIIKLIAQKESIIGVIGDMAQSIYSFQGADVEQFNNFELPEMLFYKMQDNHRSTEQILQLLNTIRTDITQKSPKKKIGEKPLVLIGQPFSAVSHIHQLINSNNLYTLSFSNIVANSMRDKVEYAGNLSSMTIDSIFSENDSNKNRRKIIISLIKTIEFAKQKNYKNSIQEIRRNLMGGESHRVALTIIHQLLNEYAEYSNKSMMDFYDIIKALDVFQLPNFQIRKNNPTQAESFYKNIKYSEVALLIKHQENIGRDRTIHQAKGSEFENVLVIIKPKSNQKYNEDRDLAFLLSPDINNEEHRVYYVAASRAQKNLYFCVPSLSPKAASKLEEVCEIKHIEI